MSDVITAMVPAITAAEEKHFATGGETALPVSELRTGSQPRAEPSPVAEETPPASAAPPEVPVTELERAQQATREIQDRYHRGIGTLASKLEQVERAVRGERAPQPVTVETDPVSVVRDLQQWRQGVERNAQIQQVVGNYRGHAAEFTKQNSDFADAYQHFQKSVQSELRAVGYSDADLAQQAARMELAIVGRAMQAGENPAQRIYELSALRGYRPPVAAAAAPAAAPAPSTPTTRRMAQSPPGQSDAGLRAFLELDEDEIGAMSDKQFRKMWGGT